MTIDVRMERLYQQVELVRGIGNRRRGQLCVMSFVAFLAGEGHTDKPDTASPLIRQFAIVINDSMPADLRQRLKSFVPRIIGSRDDQDAARAGVLRKVLASELLPQIALEFPDGAADRRSVQDTTGSGQQPDSLRDFQEAALRYVSCASEQANMQIFEGAASAVARLISYCAGVAATPARRNWYWLKAIELLDDLCDIGAERLRRLPDVERLASIEDYLIRRHEARQLGARVAAAFARVCNFSPTLIH